MTKEILEYKAREFKISYVEAIQLRIIYLRQTIEELESEWYNLQVDSRRCLIRATETEKVMWADLIEEVEAKILKLKTETKDLLSPTKFKRKTKVLDWELASQYPCTSLLGQPKRKHGNEWIYNSPFREDSTPSFSVNTEKNLWHDFGSGEGGDVFSLYQKLNNVSKVEACKFLLDF